jgi:hypothetical protein
LSLGKDVTTNTDIAVSLAAQLQRHNPNGTPRGTMFVPEGAWTLDDFLQQCAEDPEGTLGAFLVLPSTYESKNDNYLVMIRSTATMGFNTMVATCNPDKKEASVDWVADESKGVYGRSVIQFLPFAVLTSVYLAFAAQRLFQTVATRVFPTPNPLPPSGAQNSVVTTTQTTLNASGTGSLQNSVVQEAGIAALLFGRQGTPEHFGVHAAEDVVTQFFLKQLLVRCPSWNATPSPSATTPPADQPTPAPPCGW